jgi:hypothetical protein
MNNFKPDDAALATGQQIGLMLVTGIVLFTSLLILLLFIHLIA